MEVPQLACQALEAGLVVQAACDGQDGFVVDSDGQDRRLQCTDRSNRPVFKRSFDHLDYYCCHGLLRSSFVLPYLPFMCAASLGLLPSILKFSQVVRLDMSKSGRLWLMCGVLALEGGQTTRAEDQHVTERHKKRSVHQIPEPVKDAPSEPTVPEDAPGDDETTGGPDEQPKRIPGQFGYFPENWPRP
jgi:hypothetical protein